MTEFNEMETKIEELLKRSFYLIDDKQRFEVFVDEVRKELEYLKSEIDGYPKNKLSEMILEKIQNKESVMNNFTNKANELVSEIQKLKEKIQDKKLNKKEQMKVSSALENLFFTFTRNVMKFEETVMDLEAIFELVDVLKGITPKEDQPKEITTGFNYEEYKEKIESEVAILKNTIMEIEKAFGKPEWKLIAERAGFIERLEYIDKRIDDTHKFIRMGLIIISVVFGLISSISLIFITLLMSGIIPK